MQQSLGLIFKNTLLTGGGGVRGFLGQRGQLTPFVDGLVRGSNVSTFSGGGPTNVLDSLVYHHGGAFSGHLRFGGMQLSSSFVALRGIYCGGGLSFSTFAGRGSSNVLDPHVYHQAVSFNNYIRSSTWTLSRYYSSNVPLPSRHLEVNGKDCTVTCDDDQYQVLCELLSIPFGSGIPEMKVYSHPDQFIREAEKYERVGDYIQSSKKSWGAYVLTIKSLYKNLQINIQSHDTLHKLSLFAIGLDDDVPNKESLGFTVRLMNG
ncbi:unnamed protein product [Meloidogyne enterolobii]|uniref:Uncharacterized protein n=1 Tax=Meloidogyne enterolobii TaxID=390850 RepID=A0ACB1BAB9_MELEN